MQDHYILVGQTPVPVEPCDPYTPEGQEGLLRWARSLEVSDRRVAETWLYFRSCRVSTVFLGLDHNFGRILSGNADLPPLLFETMSFWLHNSEHQERCATWLEAEAMHRRVVRECRKPWVAVPCLVRALREKLRAIALHRDPS